MADTGSEMAESGARIAPHVAERMLERHFMLERMERMVQGQPEITRTGEPVEAGRGTVTLEVRPAKTHDIDLRAHEVLDALERAGTSADFLVDDERKAIILTVPEESAERTQRALERLMADTHTSFTLGEVTGLNALEEATGHRTLHPWARGKTSVTEPLGPEVRDDVLVGGPHDPITPQVPDAGQDTGDVAQDASRTHVTDEGPSLEHVTLTFANHPDDTQIDREHAEGYAARMRERGIDAHVGDERADGSSVVALTFPVAENDAFLTASCEALTEIGALEPDADEASLPEHEDGMSPEHVMVAFASDPERDRELGEAYTEAMGRRGYDPWHGAMGTPRGVRHTIELSYPAGERGRFVRDHTEALMAIGALDAPPELDVLEEPVAQPRSLQDLVAERVSELSRDVPSHEAMAADDYLALAPHRRARIAPERIPDEAFGRPSLAQTMAVARAAADELALEAAPELAIEHALGERA